MRLILDEYVDRRLAKDFVRYDVKTVPQIGWAGIKNGQQLTLVEAPFGVFITVHHSLAFQQNLPQLGWSEDPGNNFGSLCVGVHMGRIGAVGWNTLSTS